MDFVRQGGEIGHPGPKASGPPVFQVSDKTPSNVEPFTANMTVITGNESTGGVFVRHPMPAPGGDIGGDVPTFVANELVLQGERGITNWGRGH